MAQPRHPPGREVLGHRRYHHHHLDEPWGANHSSSVAARDAPFRHHASSSWHWSFKPKPPVEPPELKLPKPIILVGFPKAGTSSIFDFFQQQFGGPPFGLRCQHWYCCKPQKDAQKGGPGLMADCMLDNLAANRSILEGCGDLDVLTEINGPRRRRRPRRNHLTTKEIKGQQHPPLQGPEAEENDDQHLRIFFPQFFHLEEIHQQHPNATLILNTRPLDSWIQSVLSVQANDLAQQFANEFYAQGIIDHLPKSRRQPPNNLGRNDQDEMVAFLKDLYHMHHNQVRDFVRQNPSHTLVQVPITEAKAGKILADAFGLDATKWRQINPTHPKGSWSLITLQNRFLLRMGILGTMILSTLVCVRGAIFRLKMEG